MEHHTGSDAHASLRLVDAGGDTVWEPDPAVDADELDALAELFIGDDHPIAETAGTPEEDRPDRAPARLGGGGPGADAPPAVEALITGHLPVRGAVWVRAYAASVSRAEKRPVALVRVTGDRTTVELIGSAVATEPVTDIGLAIEAVSSAATHWLLHFDELDQAGLLRETGLDRVTVLSGADEPAVVSAYRLVKSVCDDRGEAALEGELDVGISIVGSGPDETARAADRLAVAARRFLSLELAPRLAVPRVETVTVSLIGDRSARCEPSRLLEAIAECIDDETSACGDPAHVIRTALDAVSEAEGDESACDPSDAAAPAAVNQSSPSTPFDPFADHTAADASAASRDAAPTKERLEADAPTAAGPATIAGPAAGSRPEPSRLVAGLTGLGLPCPVASGVELAADGDGGLHLLCWWDEAAPGALLKARVWAGVNLPLLARVAPVSDRRPVEVHVVCDSVEAASDVRGGGFRVHLARPAAPVTVDGWVTAPLG